MKKIIVALKFFLETVYIYFYMAMAVIFGFIVCCILSLIPKKKQDNFTFDGYDL